MADASVPSSLESWLLPAIEAIGLATFRTDLTGRVRDMNPVAQKLTGWTLADALGRPLVEVYTVVHESTRLPIHDFLASVIETGVPIRLSDHKVLISRQGQERRIDHGVAPERDSLGAIVGTVIIFCDVNERQRLFQGVEDARAFANSIVQTVREPLVVLDAQLHIVTTNEAYCQMFKTNLNETQEQSFFTVGQAQWNIPILRDLLEKLLPVDAHFDDIRIEQDSILFGRRTLLINARQLKTNGHRFPLILLTIEDATKRIEAVETISHSEVRYRRLFETAQDGILLVDPVTRQIFDANPFLSNLIGYSRSELIGQELWQIGLFCDIESNKSAFRTLQEIGYIRYDDLPLLTRAGERIEVEFVSNVYPVGDTQVIQCNIRDVTFQKKAEALLRLAHDELEVRVVVRTTELANSNASLTQEIQRREAAEIDRRSLQQQLTTVQEDERRRISRELHDQMGQLLTAIGLGLKIVKDATPESSPQRDRLQQLQSLTDTIGREIHQLAMELRPTALDDIGLQAALINYLEAWSERSKVEIDFHTTGLEKIVLHSTINTVTYRIVQEALTNVLKHASATRVSVVLSLTAEILSVIIEDDGVGFDTDVPVSNRLGLLGMRERATLIGGSLVIDSNLQSGTTVIARIPINQVEHTRLL